MNGEKAIVMESWVPFIVLRDEIRIFPVEFLIHVACQHIEHTLVLAMANAVAALVFGANSFGTDRFNAFARGGTQHGPANEMCLTKMDGCVPCSLNIPSPFQQSARIFTAMDDQKSGFQHFHPFARLRPFPPMRNVAIHARMCGERNAVPSVGRHLEWTDPTGGNRIEERVKSIIGCPFLRHSEHNGSVGPYHGWMVEQHFLRETPE